MKIQILVNHSLAEVSSKYLQRICQCMKKQIFLCCLLTHSTVSGV